MQKLLQLPLQLTPRRSRMQRLTNLASSLCLMLVAEQAKHASGLTAGRASKTKLVDAGIVEVKSIGTPTAL